MTTKRLEEVKRYNAEFLQSVWLGECVLAIETLTASLAAIDAGLLTEFNFDKGDRRSGDLLEDFAVFLAHHKEKERQLAEVTRDKDELDRFSKTLKDGHERYRVHMEKQNQKTQSQLTTAHLDNERLREELKYVIHCATGAENVFPRNTCMAGLNMDRIKKALATATPNPIEQELKELRRDKQTLIDAAWHFHNCKYCGEGSSCDDGAAHGERLLAISDSASKEGGEVTAQSESC